VRAALLGLALVACTPPRRVSEPSAPPREGLSIAMYSDGMRTLSLVDDRRTIEVRSSALVIDPIEEGAELASLVVEPASAAGQGLVVEACRRATPRSVHCTVRGASGPVFVRILYVSSSMSFKANHYVVVAGPRASITTHFVLELPAWGRRAAITLHDGIPGRAQSAAQIGAVERDLDGTTAVIETPERDVQARRLLVFDPMRTVDDELRDEEVSAAMRSHAWEWIELVDTSLSTGFVRAIVDVESENPADTEASTGQLVRVDGNLRIPVRPDEHVRGHRERFGSPGRDQFQFVLTSSDVKPRHVLVEESLRSASTRTIEDGAPHPPTIVDDVARLELDVPASGSVRARFVVRYEP
jgi:hypothetical protein